MLGGTRSGKSSYAETLAAETKGPVRYLATAALDPADTDFAARIARHRDRRPAGWTVVETAEADLAAVVADSAETTLVDDIGTWLTGRLDALDAWNRPHGAASSDTDSLIRAVDACPSRLILVTPEVGLGVVPPTRSGRVFRDELGDLNQQLALTCDDVFFVIAGLPLRLK